VKETLEFMIKGIVKNPDSVRIEEIPKDQGVVFQVGLADEDVGQLIGKDGRTIKSINILLNAIAGEKQEKFILKVLR
jgi:hypothetical protein